jgi:hypothetical protein
MTIEKFDTLGEQLTFVHEVTSAGVRVKIRPNLEVEVPDGYVRGQTSPEVAAAYEAASTTSESDVQEATTVAAEPLAEPKPESVQEPQPERPSRSATRSEWAAYADALGHSTEGLTKSEIIDLVKE